MIATLATTQKNTDLPYYLALLSAIENAEDRIRVNAANLSADRCAMTGVVGTLFLELPHPVIT